MNSIQTIHGLATLLAIAMGFALAACGDTGPQSTTDADNAIDVENVPDGESVPDDYWDSCQSVTGGVAKCSPPLPCVAPDWNPFDTETSRSDRLCDSFVNSEEYLNPALGITCDPDVLDCDGDGISDIDEMFLDVRMPTRGNVPMGANYPTLFYLADTDGDGTDDLDEIQQGTDPTDPDDPFTRNSDRGYTGGEVQSVVQAMTIASRDCCVEFDPDETPFRLPPAPQNALSTWQNEVSYLLSGADEGSFALDFSNFPTSSEDSNDWAPGASDNVFVTLIGEGEREDDMTGGGFIARITQSELGEIRIRAREQSFTVTLDPTASADDPTRQSDPHLNAIFEALGDEVSFGIHRMAALGVLQATLQPNPSGDVTLSTASNDDIFVGGAITLHDIVSVANLILSQCLTPEYRDAGFLTTVEPEESSALALACHNDVTFGKVEFERDGLAGFCAEVEDARYDLCHTRLDDLVADVDTDGDDVFDALSFGFRVQLSDTATAAE